MCGITRSTLWDYNRKVDDALPLDEVIKPNAELRKLLEDIDTSKIRLWLFTNAYITHGKRVVKLLQIEDLFEGITYCDYGSDKFYCKPHPEMFDKAMEEAGVKSNQTATLLVRTKTRLNHNVNILGCLHRIDDSYINAEGAFARGWNTVHLLDPADPDPSRPACKHQIRNHQELRTIFPQFFKSSAYSEKQ